jgi:NAD+ synthase (glutamine-hydrolysing)
MKKTLDGTSISDLHSGLVKGLKNYFDQIGFTKATLGLSGGIDSAVVVALAVEALGNENVRVLLLPSQHSSDHSIQDAKDLAVNLDIQYDIVPIEPAYTSIERSLQPIFGDSPKDVTEENIQARIRAVLLMALSNKMGHILLNTSNKSEILVGYGTLYGDTCGAISVIGGVYKKDVYQLADYINRDTEIIPQNTIDKAPSAELSPGQKDSDSLPDYDTLDAILYNYIDLKKSADEVISMGFDKALVEKTIGLNKKNSHKVEQLPLVLAPQL